MDTAENSPPATHSRIPGWVRAALKLATVILLNGGEVALQVVTLFVAAKILGADTGGRYVYVIECCAIALLVGQFGFDMSAVRFVSASVSRQAWAQVRGFLHFSYRIIALASLVAATAMVAIGYAANDNRDANLLESLTLGALTIPAIAVHQLHAAVLRGLGVELLARALRLIPWGFVLIGLLVAGYADPGSALSTQWLLSTHLAAGLVSACASGAVLCRSLPQHTLAPYENQTGVWLRASAVMAFAAGIMVIQTRLDTVMMASLRNEASACVYALVVRLSMMHALALTSINYLLMPRCARLHAEGRRDELQQLVRRGGRLSLAATLPVMVAMTFLAPTALAWVGEDFSRGYGPMLILMFGYLGFVAAGPVGVVAMMTGNERLLAKGQTVCVAANAGMNLIAIPLFGLAGAAATTAAVTVIGRFALSHIVASSTGINTFPLSTMPTRPAPLAANSVGIAASP